MGYRTQQLGVFSPTHLSWLTRISELLIGVSPLGLERGAHTKRKQCSSEVALEYLRPGVSLNVGGSVGQPGRRSEEMVSYGVYRPFFPYYGKYSDQFLIVVLVFLRKVLVPILCKSHLQLNDAERISKHGNILRVGVITCHWSQH